MNLIIHYESRSYSQKLSCLCRVCAKSWDSTPVVLRQQNTFLTFLCDINLCLIEGPHLLLASVTCAFTLAALHRGRSRGQTQLLSCSLGCSDIYWNTNPEWKPKVENEPPGWRSLKRQKPNLNKKGKIQNLSRV